MTHYTTKREEELSICGIQGVNSKGVYVTLVAPWTETPFLQEGCEWASTYGGFYQCIYDVWHHMESLNNTGGALTLTQKVQYDILLHLMKNAKRPYNQLKLLEMKLSARVYSPAVEAHWQLSRRAVQLTGGCAMDKSPFVLIAGRAICDVQLLENALSTYVTSKVKDIDELSLLFSKLDHIHPASRGHHVAILYGIIGEQKTMRFLHILERHLNGICLAFRHLPVIGAMWEGSLYVQGYGVTVDLRNLEYKVINEEKNNEDINTDSSETNTQDDGEGTEPVGGFNLHRLRERYPHLKDQLSSFKEHLGDMIEQTEVKADFQIWETQYMGIAAAQYVMDTANGKRMETLMNILTMFPFYSSKLSKMGTLVHTKMDNTMRELLLKTEGMRLQGLPSVFLNGRSVSIQETNLFSLLEKLEADERVLEDIERVLTSVSIPSSNNNGFLLIDSNTMNKMLNRVKQKLYSNAATKRSNTRFWISKHNIFWLNNIETDPSYAHLPRRLNTILTMGPNNMPRIPRNNIFHIVSIVDLTTAKGIQNLAMMLRLEERKQPLRMGVLFADTKWSPNMEASRNVMEDLATSSDFTTTSLIAATVWELLNEGNYLREVLHFLTELILTSENHGRITEADVENAAVNILSRTGKRDLYSVLTNTEFSTYYQNTQAIIHALQLRGLPITFINGNIFHGNIIKALQDGFLEELNHVRKLVEGGKLIDKGEDLYDSIMKLSGAKRRYRVSIYEDETYVDWTSKPVLDFLHYRSFLFPASYSGQTSLVSGVLIFRSPMELENVHALKKAAKQLVECKESAHDCSSVRLTYAFCGVETHTKRRTIAGDLERLLVLMENDMEVDKKQQTTLIYEFLSKINSKNGSFLLDDPDMYESLLTHISFSSQLQRLLDINVDTLDVNLQLQLQQQRALVNGFCAQMEAQTLSLGNLATTASSKNQVDNTVYYYANGRRFLFDDTFMEEEFVDATLREVSFAAVLLKVLNSLHYEKISDALQRVDLDNRFFASKIAALVGLPKRNAAHGDSINEEEVMPPAPGPTSFIVQPVNTNIKPRHRLTVIIDPISQQSQLPISLCNYFTRSSIGVSCTVYLSSLDITKSKPMRSFYQFVADTQLRFDATGSVLPPAAIFPRLPSQSLLTLGIEEPESWTVFSLEAAYDLDNIVLANLPPTSNYLYATYRINSILVSGKARETGFSSPPRGLPLVIRSSRTNDVSTVVCDTLVMANLGYFQLQATAGVWYLGVKPGDVAKAFYISHVNNVPVSGGRKVDQIYGSNHSTGQSIPVVVSSFTGEFITLDVAKASGYEEKSIEDFLKVPPSRSKWPPKGPRATKPERPTLNIFSVVSGHLYERFLRMMMHSVMQTSSDVHGVNTTRIKFWVIENFLSPQFRTLVPLLAKHYGFDVGFVTYHWPWWLEKQIEKQRKIWGYKILFLDVLFPLDVDRIIFVDADQKVFVDMHDLYNMNIGHAPMAYTPFCRKNPNKETKNFRFWDQGFWLEHLRGKPYHISALYLVDLQRLRAMGGSEKYRVVYGQLSQDPNSLANLDQDLPNFMQDQVPIYSLPEEWLWCETWCGAESKAKAKTIDLCNNPLTKTPKLENAKKIIPEWEELDMELEALSKKLLRQNRVG